MQQVAERLFEDDLDLGLADVPLRLLVAPGEAQEQVARGRHAPRHRQVRPGAERVPEPAARQLGDQAKRHQSGVLRLIKAVEHYLLIAELPQRRMA
jgi:hypothetical protein